MSVARRLHSTASEVLLRTKVLLKRPALTYELATGAEPASRRELELRAGELISDRTRRPLARTLSRCIDDARRPRMHRAWVVMVDRRSVLAAERPLRRLIARLGDGAPVQPEGTAMTERLIIDGAWSPLYGDGPANLLSLLVMAATKALGPGTGSDHEFALGA